MQVVLSFTILTIMLAVSDMLATKTKAVLGTMFTFPILLLIAFWNGLPKDTITVTGATVIAPVCCALLLVNQGASLTLDQFVKEWKTVVVGFLQVAAVTLTCAFVGQFIIGKVAAYSGAPIVAGAMVAYMVMTEPLLDAGLNDIAAFCMVIMVLQNLVGIPLATLIMKKDARNLIASGQIENYRQVAEIESGAAKRKYLFPQIPEKYNKSSVMLAKAMLVGLLAFWLSDLTNGTINSYLLCMILGVVFGLLGFIEQNYLDKAGAMGMVQMLIVFFIYTNNANTTPEMILDTFVPFAVIMGLGVAAMFVCGFICSKIFKMSFGMTVAIGLTGLFGFPTTFYIARSVAEAVGGDDKEQCQALENYLMPRMLVAGFATVTIGSVIAASMMLPLLKAALM